jgi:hypothetical protein
MLRELMRPPRDAVHPGDIDGLDIHFNFNPMSWPHSHVIREDWSHEKKQRVARHIDRWHTPMTTSDEEETVVGTA